MASTAPRYYEIEQFRRAGNRKLWAAIALLAVTTILSGLVTLALALRPVPVIAFDSTGKPLIFADTYSPATQTDRVRVDWFVRYFLSKYVEIDSARLEEDFAEALNLMTPQLRQIELKDGAELARRRHYKDGNIRSHLEQLEVRIGDFDPRALDQPIYLYAWGRHVFEPLFGKVSEADKAASLRFVFLKLMLERHPVAKDIPHGLLIRYVEWYSLETQEQLDAELLKLSNKG